MTDTRCVLITGGASGIGLATARAALAEGWSVALLDRDEGNLKAARDGLDAPDRVETLACSVTDEAGVAAAVGRCEDRLGPLSGLVNSAGIGLDAQALDTEVDDFRRVLEVNLIGTFIAARTVAARMVDRGRGAIVNIASVSGMVGNVGRTAYGASKGGIVTMTKVMAVELAPFGVRSNAVAPGPVETPLVSDMHTEAMRRSWAETIPQARYGTPEEIAQAALFLLDDARSGYVTGQVLAVDGGFTTSGILRGVARQG
ncbi:SDR family NAD(P)-dependent oxidoreductase [Jannaschia rubra]|uniref:SDR family NAD(P)-dependent oxidoreductase n=1 Tax=Jannaschia rubra TaxID=282197 RepID=UPI00248FEE47|nr:SDR family oxidoreductase [Jannaschia rubra]